MDRYRGRSPDRDRDRYAPGPPATDSYIPPTSIRAPRPRSRSPGGFRRRSRSPRLQGDTWRGRHRSPPRRFEGRADAYTPRDARSRSPRRDYIPPDTRYDDGIRALRGRTPPPLKRGREATSPGRNMRSPPPAKRERYASPPREYGRARSPLRRGYSPPRDGRHSPPPPERNAYRPRSRSPQRRDERVDPYAVTTWRRRSPSPPRSGRLERPGEVSGRNSVTTSRRSSLHAPSRKPALTTTYDTGDVRAAPSSHRPAEARSPLRARSPGYQSPSRRASPPPPRPGYRESLESPYELRTKLTNERDYISNGNARHTGEAGPHAAPAEYRDRAPPTGPASARHYPSSAMSPPVGPPSAPVSMSAHNRPGSTPFFSAPSHPRGDFRGEYRGDSRGDFRGGYRGRGGPPRGGYRGDFSGPPPRRGSSSWGGPPTHGRGGGPPRDPYPPREEQSYDGRGPPTPHGHRDGGMGFGPGGYRSSNSTSTTYPRTQRFNQHLEDLPTIKEGGQRLPPLHDTAKADKLEEEAARLRKMIDEKESRKRQGLREWDKLERESATAALKSELAEEHLRQLNGENEGTAAAF